MTLVAKYDWAAFEGAADMRLNPDSVREMLLCIESQHDGPTWNWSVGSAENYTEYYTAKKLLKAGLISGLTLPGDDDENNDEYIEIQELTFSGHQLLEAIRDPKIWKAVKAGVGQIGNASIGMLIALGTEYGKAQLRQIGVPI